MWRRRKTTGWSGDRNSQNLIRLDVDADTVINNIQFRRKSSFLSLPLRGFALVAMDSLYTNRKEYAYDRNAGCTKGEIDLKQNY